MQHKTSVLQRFIYSLCIALLAGIWGLVVFTQEKIPVMEGDIVFQISKSVQSLAIQTATKSKYSHIGIVLYQDGKPYVLEAVQPVKFTSLQKWIERGENKHCVIKRLKGFDTLLTKTAMKKIYTMANSFLGKDYDLTFSWTDSRMYCSELVWKIYERALGVKIGNLQKLKDFDLSSPVVQGKLKERYGSNIPLNETVISPQAMFASDLLFTVKEIR